ncbi:hypothetical protein ACFQZZ_13185 [Nocardia sp. GCM10030253]|uniref:hypothetical protein n=1 Tax=Nocardia sp. GCM10030253 TaxID=3273404 RepID=UPI00363FD725
MAERVEQLFVAFHSRTEPERSGDEVARELTRRTGFPVSAGVLKALRRGISDGDPVVLAALAGYFGVPASYLTGSGPEVVALHRQLELLRSIREAGVTRLALRGGGTLRADADLSGLVRALDAL